MNGFDTFSHRVNRYTCRVILTILHVIWLIFVRANHRGYQHREGEDDYDGGNNQDNWRSERSGVLSTSCIALLPKDRKMLSWTIGVFEALQCTCLLRGHAFSNLRMEIMKMFYIMVHVPKYKISLLTYHWLISVSCF